MEEGKLLEPIKYYKTELAQKFLDKLTALYDDLVKKSNIDIKANEKSFREYEKLEHVREKSKTILKIYKTISGLLTFVIIYLMFLVWRYGHLNFAIFRANLITNDYDYHVIIPSLLRIYEKYPLSSKYTLMAFGGIVFVLLFKYKFMKKKIKKRKKRIEELDKEVADKKEECYSQVRPLLNLFDDRVARNIINEIIPTLNVDLNFKIGRYANLVKNYGMIDRMGFNLSAKDIISGEILGNPFVILKSMANKVVEESYTGSRTVSWTEYYRDSDGKSRSRTVTQTLYATVYKPKQVFNDKIYLLYGNDAAEHLEFIRKPNYVHEFSPRKLKKYIKKGMKEVERATESAIRKGGNFMGMQNTEFEALFDALDRNNEVEFRVLFTPIAQKNMLDLIKDKDFGDDFTFLKNKKINSLSNGRDWILNTARNEYNHFEYATIKQKFFDINKSYFSNFYRLFLPILSIPVYHQHKAVDYIYGNDYNFNYNPYSAEVMANSMGAGCFHHPSTTTQSILKTRTVKTSGKVDLVEVTARSYKEVVRVDYISKMANNGRWYDVPVEWIEYVPLENKNLMEMASVEKSIGEINRSLTDEYFEKTKGKTVHYKNSMLAIVNPTGTLELDEIINKLRK